VELYEYNRTMMHHKIMMIDGLWSTVGTANFDNRSFSHNEESNVSVLNEGVTRELGQSFEQDIAVSERVTKDAWQHRGLPHRTIEALASFVQDQV
jgi:cardiolipin synthase